VLQLTDIYNPEEFQKLHADALISGAKWAIAGSKEKCLLMNDKVLEFSSMVNKYYELYCKIQDILDIMIHNIDTAERARKVNNFIGAYNDSYTYLINLIQKHDDIDEKLRVGNIKYGELKITVKCFINANAKELSGITIDD
jgi:hypothetical protein